MERQTDRQMDRQTNCRVFKGAGSQSVVSVATYSRRPAAARLLIGWQQQ